MSSHSISEYEEPILKVLKEMNNEWTSDSIYDSVTTKHITLNSDDLNKIIVNGKEINYTISRNNFAWALVRLGLGGKIKKVRSDPNTYRLLS